MKKLVLGVLLSSFAFLGNAQEIKISVTYNNIIYHKYKYADFNDYVTKRACYVDKVDTNNMVVVMKYNGKKASYFYELPYIKGAKVGDMYVMGTIEYLNRNRGWGAFKTEKSAHLALFGE